MGNLSIRVGFDTERALAGAFTGVSQNVGTPLAENPVVMIFDNQSSVAVALSVDGGSTTWKTFSAGEAFVLDLRANHGNAPNYTVDIGTQFSLIGSGGTGSFRIAILFAKG